MPTTPSSSTRNPVMQFLQPDKFFPESLFTKNPSRALRYFIVFACGIVALLILSRMAWSAFHLMMRNDGDSLFYGHYIRNLLRYPFTETYGLMADLVGATPAPLIVGAPRTYYADHPMGFVWLAALTNWAFVSDPILAGRWTNIACVVVMLCATIGFVLKRSSLFAGLCSVLVALTIPLVWEHGPVIGLQAAPLLFTVAATFSFIRYLRQPSSGTLALTVLFWALGMFSDWPAYLLGGPIAFALALRRKWLVLAFMGAIGCGAMALVFLHQVLAFNFDVGKFVISTFLPSIDKKTITLPFGEALVDTMNYAWRSFRWWTPLILLPLLIPSRWFSSAAKLQELRIAYLSFLFIGIINDIIFIQWAATHSYWSFFLIPAAIVGSSLLILWICDREKRWLRLSVAGIIVIGAFLNAKYSWSVIKYYVRIPPSAAEILGPHKIEGLLDSDSQIVTDPDCMSEARPAYPVCSVYSTQGALARYHVDKPSIPASHFPVQDRDCSRMYLVLKQQPPLQRLAEQQLEWRHIELFGWWVLKGSDLPSQYCSDPKSLFARLKKT